MPKWQMKGDCIRMEQTKTIATTRRLVITGLCLALGVLLPQLVHFVPLPAGMNAGSVLCPMHLPVLLAGFLAGGPWGLACGILTPLLSSVLTGMPPLYPVGVSMICELASYGLLAGLLYRRSGKKLFLSLIGAMLGGRLVLGVANTLIYGVFGSGYTLTAFLSGAFVTALPGIIAQLVLVPAIVTALKKANLAD